LIFLGLILCCSLAGCSRRQVRSQKEEESEKDRYPVRTVADVSSFANANPIPVSGVGLVAGLEGTGSPAPAGPMRQIIEHELKREKVENVKEILASKNFSVVQVSAVLPAGARKGDVVDIEVTLPPGSRTMSLRGGYLRRCVLHNFDYTGNI